MMGPMRLALPVLCSLSACWVTSDEIEEARARVQAEPVTPVPSPVPSPVPTPPPPTDTGNALPCVDGLLPLNVIQSGDTTEAADDLALQCGTSNEPERVYLYTPAVEGCHSLRARTTGSAPVAVGLFQGCDSASQVDCTDGQGSAVILRPLAAGQGVLVAVERQTPGAFDVDVAPVFDEDMGSTDQIDTTNADKVENPFPRMCLGALDPGTATGATYVRWVAPHADTYEVRLTSDVMDAILSLHRACQQGTHDGCSDALGVGVTEVMVFPAEAGEEVLFRVAAYGESRGAFTLRVEPADGL